MVLLGKLGSAVGFGFSIGISVLETVSARGVCYSTAPQSARPAQRWDRSEIFVSLLCSGVSTILSSHGRSTRLPSAAFRKGAVGEASHNQGKSEGEGKVVEKVKQRFKIGSS